MFTKLSNWLDHRTGYHNLVKALLIEHIPGGAKWRYVWGSCLAFVFSVQLLTGVLLMTAYSPGDSTAWSSVYFIQYEMDFGWLIRGLHHFGSQAMVVLLGVHMLQVVIAGAHLPPREVNWWLGLALLGTVLGLSLTGYLLPWDQKGYWATQVATNIAGNLPVLGPWLQKIVVGGPEYGHHTLTRFFTLHVGVLPPLLIVLIIAHLTVFRRHGITTPKNAPGEGWFWPDQAFRDMLASMAIFGILLSLVLWGHGHKVDASSAVATDANTTNPGFYGREGRELEEQIKDLTRRKVELVETKEFEKAAELRDQVETLKKRLDDLAVQQERREIESIRWAHAGRAGLGANLDAPADPSRPYPARPEWYFLFLFQLLKYFEGEQEIIGTVLIPTGAGLLLAVLPLLGYGPLRKPGHVFGVLVIVGLLASVVALTILAFADDTVYPLSRALLVPIATRLVPICAAVLLIELALLALLHRRVLRRTVKLVSLAMFALLIGTSLGLVYLAVNTDQEFVEFEKQHEGDAFTAPRIPSWLRTRIETQMTAQEKAPRSGARKFHQELVEADHLAARAITLAKEGIPADGSISLLRRDPLTRGKELFQQHCASCHTYAEEGKNDKATASDLAGFGTAEWIGGLLKEPRSPHYFGRTKLKEMSSWVERTRATHEKKGKGTELDADFAAIAEWLASHPRAEIPEKDDGSRFFQGYQKFATHCSECHAYKSPASEESKGPDFTGYGDANWLRLMIMAPQHPERYGDKNAMPAFRSLEGPEQEVRRLEFKEKYPETQLIDLGDVDRELIIRWLTKDYRVVFGGEPITAPSQR